MIDSRGGSEPRAAERSLPSMPVRVTRGELERWAAVARLPRPGAPEGSTLSAWVRETLDLVAEMAEVGAALRAGLKEQRKPLLPPAEDLLGVLDEMYDDRCAELRAKNQRDTLPAPPGDE